MKKFHPGNHHYPQLSTGQRCMGWLLALTPLLGALSLCTAAARYRGTNQSGMTILCVCCRTCSRLSAAWSSPRFRL